MNEVREQREGKQKEVRKKKRRSPGQAVRLSARGAFVLRELFKVRRMTVQQIARLCVISAESEAPVDMCRRLKALGYIRVDDLFLDRSKVVVSLTEPGRRFAIDRLGRGHRSTVRDDGKDEFTLHALRGAELYVELVAGGAKDWIAAQANADRFEWYSSNEGAEFTWRGVRELGSRQSAERKVIPDAVIETAESRFMIEVERSTKTLNAVMAKIENYCHVFSLLKTSADVPPYRAKYADNLSPVLVVLLETRERAVNVARLLAVRMRGQNFPVPSVFVGALEDVVGYLRKHIGLSAPMRKSTPHELLAVEMRKYVDHIMNRTGLTSLLWPANWKTVMKGLYPPAEWSKLEAQLDLRIAESKARKAAEQKAAQQRAAEQNQRRQA